MQGTKGASEVAVAWSKGEQLRRGSARTNGESYFLFDNRIVSKGCPAEAIVEARIFGDRTDATWFTFAGWVTQTTLRHLRVVTGFHNLAIVKGRPVFGSAPGGIGERIELDSNDWYCFEKLRRLQKQAMENQHATV